MNRKPDWYATRKISWHISVVYYSAANKTAPQSSFGTLFCLCSLPSHTSWPVFLWGSIVCPPTSAPKTAFGRCFRFDYSLFLNPAKIFVYRMASMLIQPVNTTCIEVTGALFCMLFTSLQLVPSKICHPSPFLRMVLIYIPFPIYYFYAIHMFIILFLWIRSLFPW